MKKIIYIIVLLIGTICSAQNETLLEYEWKLEYIELNGETLYQPDNEESEYPITIDFYENAFGNDFFNFQHHLICDGFFCESLEFDVNNTFEFLSCSITLDGCSIEENSFFQADYMMVYQDLLGDGEVFSPFTYSFVTEEDIIFLTITNSEGNSATYSATTLSNGNFKKPIFSIYPNPVTSHFYVTSDQTQLQQVDIFNLNGKRVLNIDYKENQAIEISSMPKGIYVVKFETDEGSFVKKLVKE